MKRSLQAVLGVTLLEIMLVLAIAAMVITMSIRYYQSASLNQKVTAALNSVTAVVAAGESVLSAQGVTGFTGTNAANFNPFLPGGAPLPSPWGGTIVPAGTGANTYTITIPNVPNAACTQLRALVQQNNRMTAPVCVTGNANMVITVTV